MEPRALEVEGYAGLPLGCVLHEAGGGRAAVILPGNSSAGRRLGGTPARPDLHFTRALLVESGYDVLEVWWDGDSRPEEPAERAAWYRDNALAGLRAAGQDRVRLLVGRSIGTIGLSSVRDHDDLASLWIAPLTVFAPVRDGLRAWRGPALVVVGDADEGYEPVAGVETAVVPNGDHGLAVGDAAASARALADALDVVRGWLARLR